MTRKEQNWMSKDALRKRQCEEMNRQLEERTADVDALRAELQLARAEIASLKGAKGTIQYLNVAGGFLGLSCATNNH
jgi:prefoldin subunit 5